MKLTIYVFIFFILGSCASIDTNKIAPGYKEAYINIKKLILGQENQIKPEVIKNIPYASMLVKIGNGPTALMILESKNDEEYLWVSSDGVYLLIKNGQIIKTSGLNNNLTESISPDITWSDDIYNNKEFISYRSYNLPTLNNLKLTHTYSKKDNRNVPMINGKKKLQLIEEKISSKKVAWYETNKYWVDDNNFVWKSVQHISPRLPEISFEVTKKPL